MKNDDLLKKWLNNELSDAEMKAFRGQEDYGVNQRIIDAAKSFKAPETSKVDDFKTFQEHYNNQPSVKTINWFKPMIRIASILVIALAVYFVFFNDNTVEVETLASEKTTISLPDLSEVILNADSRIEYSSNNWNSKRVVNLQGEAYFKVAKGKRFDVISPNGTVSVVGTAFNVKDRQHYFEVKCYEGIVKVVSDSITRELHAGDTYRIIDQKFTAPNTTDISPQWIKNKSSFNAVPFNDVVAELERQYDIKVELKNVLTARLFTGIFTHDDLEGALKSITLPMSLTYEISSSNQVLIHGNKE